MLNAKHGQVPCKLLHIIMDGTHIHYDSLVQLERVPVNNGKEMAQKIIPPVKLSQLKPEFKKAFEDIPLEKAKELPIGYIAIASTSCWTP